jgi:hypothetical protein
MEGWKRDEDRRKTEEGGGRREERGEEGRGRRAGVGGRGVKRGEIAGREEGLGRRKGSLKKNAGSQTVSIMIDNYYSSGQKALELFNFTTVTIVSRESLLPPSSLLLLPSYVWVVARGTKCRFITPQKNVLLLEG